MGRLDVELVQRGIVATRSKAKEYIEAGRVTVEGIKVYKPSFDISGAEKIELEITDREYVGRGGKKLEKAIEVFGIDVKGKVCADIGASTGGFTDCLLYYGAKKVYAVDVGSGQLAQKLRCDERVVNIENTNIRYMEEGALPEKADFVCADLSFISLTLVADKLSALLEDGGRCVCLIKPQFEAGRENIGKSGIVKEAKVHQTVIAKVARCFESVGMVPCALEYSPIKGGDGNTEYLILLEKNAEVNGRVTDESIEKIVKRAKKELAL